MKFLKWADDIKKPISKEEILSKAEKDEIIYMVVIGAWGICLIIGVIFIMLAPKESKIAFLGLATVVLGGVGALECTIKSYLKLERYKAMWDKIEFTQSEMRKMQAKDL